jgi:3D (Asp-Asp-Asp) domain-containing protein
MRFLPYRILAVALGLCFAGCASRPLPKYEKPIARTQFQTVRTTAYTHTESDHRQYTNKNALGSRLQSGSVHSAAADWSRWPAGTTFRILETGELHCVDDYGWALSGTNTIDLYKPSRSAMNIWGVRRVNIEVLNWGDVDRSLSILRPRAKYKHIRRMITQIEDRYTSLKQPVPSAVVATAQPAPVREAIAVQPARPAASGVPLTPFALNAPR